LLLLAIVPYFLLYTCLYVIISTKKRAGGNPGSDVITPGKTAAGHRPLLSVIIPFRNEAAKLVMITGDLEKQEWPASHTEIILVDDGSTDGSFQEAVRLTTGRKNCRVISNQGSGKKEAIAAAIGMANGAMIVTSDADCRLNNGWLSGIALVYIESGADVIIGPVYPVVKPGIANLLLQVEAAAIQSVTEATAIIDHAVMASGANLAFTRDVAGKYLDFIRPEISSGDDMFLLHRAKREKRKIVFNYSDQAEVLTESPDTFKDFFKQRTRWSSKGVKYNDTDTLVVGLITLLTNLVVATGFVLALFIPGFIKIAVAAWIVKSVPDFLLILKKTANRNHGAIPVWLLPLSLIYPFYVSVVSIAGIFLRSSWK